MKFNQLVLAGLSAAGLFAAACSPTTGPADGGEQPAADKYCLPTCAEAADCGDPAEDWACEESQCVFVHYFANGDFCADDQDCDMQAGGAFEACEADADCSFGVCVGGIGDRGFCMFEPTGGTCAIEGTEPTDLPRFDGSGNVSVCAGTGGSCGANGFCEVESTGDAGTADPETCESDEECGDDEACLEPRE